MITYLRTYICHYLEVQKGLKLFQLPRHKKAAAITMNCAAAPASRLGREGGGKHETYIPYLRLAPRFSRSHVLCRMQNPSPTQRTPMFDNIYVRKIGNMFGWRGVYRIYQMIDDQEQWNFLSSIIYSQIPINILWRRRKEKEKKQGPRPAVLHSPLHIKLLGFLNK